MSKDLIPTSAKLQRASADSAQDFLQLIKLKLQLQACNNDTCLAPEFVPVIVSTVGQ